MKDKEPQVVSQLRRSQNLNEIITWGPGMLGEPMNPDASAAEQGMLPARIRPAHKQRTWWPQRRSPLLELWTLLHWCHSTQNKSPKHSTNLGCRKSDQNLWRDWLQSLPGSAQSKCPSSSDNEHSRGKLSPVKKKFFFALCKYVPVKIKLTLLHDNYLSSQRANSTLVT